MIYSRIVFESSVPFNIHIDQTFSLIFKMQFIIKTSSGFTETIELKFVGKDSLYIVELTHSKTRELEREENMIAASCINEGEKKHLYNLDR